MADKNYDAALRASVENSFVFSTITADNINPDDVVYAADCLAMQETEQELNDLDPETRAEYLGRAAGCLVEGTIIMTNQAELEISKEEYYDTYEKDVAVGEYGSPPADETVVVEGTVDEVDKEEVLKKMGFVDISGSGECYMDKEAMKVDKGTDKEENTEQDIEQGIGQDTEQDIEQNTEQDIEEDIDEKIEK